MLRDYRREYERARLSGDREAMRRAHMVAEQKRRQLGYTGGESGYDYTSLNPAGDAYKKRLEEYIGRVGITGMGFERRADGVYEGGRKVAPLEIYERAGTLLDSENSKKNHNKSDEPDNSDIDNALAQRNRAIEDEYKRALLQSKQRKDDVARQLYINMMRSKKELPEQLNAAGLSGGAGESAMAQLESTYANNLAKILQDDANANNDMDLQKRNALLEALNAAEREKNRRKQAYIDEYNKRVSESDQSNRKGYVDELKMFKDNIAQYHQDYQQEINNLLATGLDESDPKIQMLRAARAKKIEELRKENIRRSNEEWRRAVDARNYAFRVAQAAKKGRGRKGKSSSSGSGGYGLKRAPR